MQSELISLRDNTEVIPIAETEEASDICAKIRERFKLIGCPKLNSSDNVVTKPNLCSIQGPETGATTDPKVVEGIILYLQKQFSVSNIAIVKSDESQVLADMAFKLLGYEELSKSFSVQLVNLSKASSSPTFSMVIPS